MFFQMKAHLKIKLPKRGWILTGFLVGGVGWMTLLAAEKIVFSKQLNMPLYENRDSESKVVAKAGWNEKLDILETKGSWYKVESKEGEGWVYSGNVSLEELPKENKNDVGFKSEGLTSAAATRGVTPEASAYAGRHNLGNSKGQVEWAETFNKSISKKDARAYLKSRKLGEFAEK